MAEGVFRESIGAIVGKEDGCVVLDAVTGGAKIESCVPLEEDQVVLVSRASTHWEGFRLAFSQR